MFPGPFHPLYLKPLRSHCCTQFSTRIVLVYMINNITFLYPVVNFQASVYLTNQEYLLDFVIFPSINILIGYYSLGLPLTWWSFRLLFWFLLIPFISKSQSTLGLSLQISSLYTLSLCDLIQYYGFKYQIYIISWFSSLLTQPKLALGMRL